MFEVPRLRECYTCLRTTSNRQGAKLWCDKKEILTRLCFKDSFVNMRKAIRFAIRPASQQIQHFSWTCRDQHCHITLDGCIKMLDPKKQKQESETGTSVSGPVDAHADTLETDTLT
jgi:hypothetical protein